MISDINYDFIHSLPEVQEVYNFVKKELQFPPNHPRTVDFYFQIFKRTPELLVTARSGTKIIGCVLGSINSKEDVLIGELIVLPEFRGRKIGNHLLKTLEANAVKLNHHSFILGAKRGVETFYLKNGYSANLFIQIERIDCLNQMLELNPNYSIKQKEEKEGWTRLMLETNKIDDSLEILFQEKFPKAFIIYVFTKDLKKNRKA